MLLCIVTPEQTKKDAARTEKEAADDYSVVEKVEQVLPTVADDAATPLQEPQAITIDDQVDEDAAVDQALEEALQAATDDKETTTEAQTLQQTQEDETVTLQPDTGEAPSITSLENYTFLCS